MLAKIKDFWESWAGLIIFATVLLALPGEIFFFNYIQTHRTVDIGNGVEVRSIGDVWFDRERNQFYASNELSSWAMSTMSMNPKFVLTNKGNEPREVNVSSMSAWKTPFSGKIHLEPGQQFEFQIEAVKNCEHWYCWIHPEAPKPQKTDKTI